MQGHVPFEFGRHLHVFRQTSLTARGKHGVLRLVIDKCEVEQPFHRILQIRTTVLKGGRVLGLHGVRIELDRAAYGLSIFKTKISA